MSESYDFGIKAEQLATQYLKSNGYEILERNFRFGKAEIDIIAKTPKNLIIIEVKARKTNYFGLPESFVTANKIKLLGEAANQYITTKNISLEVRFDIISYIFQKGNWERKHIKNAFYVF